MRHRRGPERGTMWVLELEEERKEEEKKEKKARVGVQERDEY